MHQKMIARMERDAYSLTNDSFHDRFILDGEKLGDENCAFIG